MYTTASTASHSSPWEIYGQGRLIRQSKPHKYRQYRKNTSYPIPHTPYHQLQTQDRKRRAKPMKGKVSITLSSSPSRSIHIPPTPSIPIRKIKDPSSPPRPHSPASHSHSPPPHPSSSPSPQTLQSPRFSSSSFPFLSWRPGSAYSLPPTPLYW